MIAGGLGGLEIFRLSPRPGKPVDGAARGAFLACSFRESMKIRSTKILLAWCLAALLWGAGCGARGVRPPLPAGRGGDLRIALPYEPRTLDPNSARDETAVLLAPNLYSRLIALDADSRLLPDLAASWTVEDRGLRYVFRLRDGVRWHDGEPFSAGDVRWTFEQLAKRPGLAAEAVRRIAAVETPDERTVEIRLREPWAPFLTALASYGTYILPRHLAGRTDTAVGTGPFRLGSWVRGRRLTLLANRSFHRPGPYLDRLVYIIGGDPGQVTEMLLRGAVDYSLLRPPQELLARLRKSTDLRIVTSPSDARYYFGFNFRRRPLDDHRVREAVNRAIDRQELLDRALHGYGAPALGFYTPAVAWAYNGDAHVPPFDRPRARQLLAAAAAPPRGEPLRLDLVAPILEPYAAMAGLLRDQLRTVGIELRPVLLPPAELLERTLSRHDFDLAMIAGSEGPDPASLSGRFGSRGPIQIMGYNSPEFDAAVAEGARTIDPQRRAQAYFRAQAILARDLPVAPLVESVHLAIFRRGISGLPQVEARGLVPAYEYSLVRRLSTSGGAR
jgi:peptide/nickel transport system substrate-binding protein